ncbi:MAG: FG-GAP-like repeat-containing protein [Vicinamibacterales bacterium]
MNCSLRPIGVGVLVAVFLFAPPEWRATGIALDAATAATIVGDAFEPDGTPAQASTITVGVGQAHTFHINGDVDYAKFSVVSGQIFTLATSSLGAGVDTVMTLFDQDGVSILASNDDEGVPGSRASRITHTSTVTGVLYVKVGEFFNTASGAYTLTLTSADDAFEVDDTAAQASLLSPGLTQKHTFNRDGDQDWAKFAVIAGRQYSLYTHHLDFGVDTVMELYASDGFTLLDVNDDGTVDLGSRIVYTATETGFYFVKVRQYDAVVGSGVYWLTLERDPGVYLNTDSRGDVLTYSPSSGAWARQVSNGSGGFVQTSGNWGTGYTVLPATFNDDALTDFFIFNTSNGQWAKMLNDGVSGFTTQATGGWYSGWQRYVMDLDDDGISDIFLYDAASGGWFRCVSTTSGFTYEQGYWSPNWEIYPVRLNLDDFGDLFLINRTTGQWFWVFGDITGFYYPMSGTWFPGWKIYPGDFNGDGMTDLFLYDSASGERYVSITTDVGFTYVNGAGWAAGWTPWVVDLNADGRADLFLYNETSGRWFELTGNGAGLFTSVGEGFWSPGWKLYPTDLNGDGRADIMLYDSPSGVWYSALNLTLGSFSYSSGFWNSGLQVVVRPPIR